MKFLGILACVVVAASAQWQPLTNGNMGNPGNMGPQILDQGNNMQNNILQMLLQQTGQMNMGQNYGQNMGPNYGQNMGQNYGQNMVGQRQQGNAMGNGVLNSLLGNMLGSVLMQNLRGQMTVTNVGGGDAEDEVSSMEDLVKRAMATEMFDIMRAYNVFKDKEEEFADSMKHLCFLVNATYAASLRYKFDIYNKTTDESVEKMEMETSVMSPEEKMAYAINILMNDEMTFNELFFRMSAWACYAGQAYLDSAMKLEKMEKGQQCDHEDK